MKGVNKVIIVGTLGKDPEVKYSANGNAIAGLSVATSETWNDKSTGTKQEKTEWHRVVIFGKLAEIVGQYLTKGSQVYLEGKLQTRKWQDQNGQDKYSTEIVIDGFSGTMQMLGGGQNTGTTSAQQQQANPQQVQNHVANNFQRQQQQPAYMPNDFDQDDVPFSAKATWPELFTLV